jgi:hypothetical protein
MRLILHAALMDSTQTELQFELKGSIQPSDNNCLWGGGVHGFLGL